LPAVWVVPQPAQFVQATYGEVEDWSMLVSLAALVKSDDPVTGSRVALNFASRARKPALTARPVDVDIVDVRSETFDPLARQNERNRELFWTDATVRVTFTVLEV